MPSWSESWKTSAGKPQANRCKGAGAGQFQTAPGSALTVKGGATGEAKRPDLGTTLYVPKCLLLALTRRTGRARLGPLSG
jgi:hypothetical protein